MEKWTEVRRKVLVEKVSKRQIRKDYRVSVATLDNFRAPDTWRPSNTVRWTVAR